VEGRRGAIPLLLLDSGQPRAAKSDRKPRSQRVRSAIAPQVIQGVLVFVIYVFDCRAI